MIQNNHLPTLCLVGNVALKTKSFDSRPQGSWQVRRHHNHQVSGTSVPGPIALCPPSSHVLCLQVYPMK